MKKQFITLFSLFLFTFGSYASNASIMFSTTPEVGGTVYPSGLHYFGNNSPYSIGVSAASGYHFVRWEPTGPVEFLSSLTDPNGLIKARNGDSTIVAVFNENDTRVTLTLATSPVTGGSTEPAIGEHKVENGQSQSIAATPTAGYSFNYWTTTGNCLIGDINDASTYVVCSADSTVTAVFSEVKTVKLTMIIDPVDTGITTPAVGEHNVAKNSAIDVTVQVNDGYQFDHWAGIGNINITITRICNPAESPDIYSNRFILL